MAAKPPERCSICGRDPEHMNSDIAECSHVDCQHRRRCWSERPEGHRYEQKRPSRDAIERMFDRVGD